MLHGAAAHHGFEVGAFIWTEGAHPKPLLSLLSEAGTWAACWGEPWPNAHSTEARSHLGSDIWERHGTSWTENVMRDPAPAEARMGPLLWKALPPGTANKSLHLPWGTDLPVLGWTKLMSRLESNMDSAQAAQDRLRDGSHTEVEQLEATACCCKAWTNPMDPRSAGPLFPQLITLFQVTALSGNQFAKFWVSPVSRLKKTPKCFLADRVRFLPSLSSQERWRGAKGDPYSRGLRPLTLSPGFAVCLPLPCWLILCPAPVMLHWHPASAKYHQEKATGLSKMEVGSISAEGGAAGMLLEVYRMPPHHSHLGSLMLSTPEEIHRLWRVWSGVTWCMFRPKFAKRNKQLNSSCVKRVIYLLES